MLEPKQDVEARGRPLRREHESEDLFRQKDLDLANLAELSEYIV